MFTVVSSPILTETLRSKLLPITQPPHLRNHVRSKESIKQISSRFLFFFLQLECARKPSAEPRTECANVEVALGLLYLIPRLWFRLENYCGHIVLHQVSLPTPVSTPLGIWFAGNTLRTCLRDHYFHQLGLLQSDWSPKCPTTFDQILCPRLGLFLLLVCIQQRGPLVTKCRRVCPTFSAESGVCVLRSFGSPGSLQVVAEGS